MLLLLSVLVPLVYAQECSGDACHWYAIGYIQGNFAGAKGNLYTPSRYLKIASGDYFTNNIIWIVYPSKCSNYNAAWIEAGIQEGRSKAGDTNGRYYTYYYYCVLDPSDWPMEGGGLINEVSLGTWHSVKIYEPSYTWIIEVDGNSRAIYNVKFATMPYIEAGGEVATKVTGTPETEMYAYAKDLQYADVGYSWHPWSGTYSRSDGPYHITVYSYTELLGHGPD
jgi:hypothetical protein